MAQLVLIRRLQQKWKILKQTTKMNVKIHYRKSTRSYLNRNKLDHINVFSIKARSTISQFQGHKKQISQSNQLPVHLGCSSHKTILMEQIARTFFMDRTDFIPQPHRSIQQKRLIVLRMLQTKKEYTVLLKNSRTLIPFGNEIKYDIEILYIIFVHYT